MIHPSVGALGRCFNALRALQVVGTCGREGAKSNPVPQGKFAMERSQSYSWLPLKGAVPLTKPTHVAWYQSSFRPTEGYKPTENHLTAKATHSILGSIPGPALHGLRPWSLLVGGTGQDHVPGVQGMWDDCF